MANEDQAYSDKSFNLKKLAIIPVGDGLDPIDVTALLVSFSLYEDIFSTSMSGELSLSDSLDLLAKLKMKGNDYLSVVFGKPGYDDEIAKLYRIYKVDNVAINNANQSHQVYNLRFCLDEDILSEQIQVSKSYKDKTTSDVIKDILTKQLKIPDDRLGTIESISQQYSYIVPSMKALEACQWVANRTDPAAIFFINSKGYQFRSFKSLFKQDTKKQYRFVPQNIEEEKNQETEYGVRNVYAYEYRNVFDSMQATTHGMYASQLLTFDPIRRTRETIKFDYQNEFDSDQHLEDKAISFANTIKNRFGKTQTQMSSTSQTIYPTTKDHDTNDNIKSKSPNLRPNKIEAWMLQNQSKRESLMFLNLKLGVPGNIQITIGDIIEFGVPSITSKDISDSNLNEPMTGRYMITALRHLITSNFKYETIIEATRDCYTNG